MASREILLLTYEAQFSDFKSKYQHTVKDLSTFPHRAT